MFHIFGQTLPYGLFVPNLGYEFFSWTLSILQSFIVIGCGVWIFWPITKSDFNFICSPKAYHIRSNYIH